MAHYTNDDWMAYIAKNFGTVGEAERWRNQNNVFVDGLPAPTYTGPLSTGGAAGVQPELPPSNPGQSPVYSPLQTQGAAKVEEDDQASPGALGTLSGGFAAPTAAEWLAQQEEARKVRQDDAAMRKSQFEEGQKLIQQNYGGPSSADRLWAISRALLAPRPYRGFAGTLYNVTNALSEVGQQQHDAERKRAEALLALQQSYQRGEMQGRRDDLSTALEVLKARQAAAKGTPFKSVIVENGTPYDPISGEEVVRPDQSAWAALQANPTRENYENFISTFGPRFQEKAARIVSAAGGR